MILKLRELLEIEGLLECNNKGPHKCGCNKTNIYYLDLDKKLTLINTSNDELFVIIYLTLIKSISDDIKFIIEIINEEYFIYAYMNYLDRYIYLSYEKSEELKNIFTCLRNIYPFVKTDEISILLENIFPANTGFNHHI